MSNIIGIDVGVGSVKAVSVNHEDKGFVLETIGEVNTPRVEWLKGDSKNKAIDTIADTIKKLLGDIKCRSRQVVTCLPEDEVVSRLIHLPPLKESEIKDALQFEAETFVPFPLDEVSIDYEVINTDDTGRISVFAIAARNEVINSYVKLFRKVGLELLALESPALAMRRAVNFALSQVSGIIFVDMGEKFSDIISIYKSNVYFTRSMSMGGDSLTRAISLNLGLDMSSAEEYKKAYGMRETELEGKIKTAMLPVFNSMAEEIRKSMALFRETVGSSPELLVLSGGGANLPGFAEELTRLLGVEVQVIQPFINIDTSRQASFMNYNSEGCRFTLAVGLALRSVI
ncbi:MAG: type IV pilus assembly protein PilM [Patescibacteria group bacterium]|jgi:type IV pilus assembly protein PilM